MDAPLLLEVPGTSARAAILLRRGATCVSCVLEGPRGPREVVWAPPDFLSAGARAAAGGIPILCPYPGRLASTAMEFEGRRVVLPPGDAAGRPIHGLVHDRPWRLVERSGDTIVARFRLSAEGGSALGAWPADFTLTATWRLRASRLDLGLELVAHGRMPAALGLHPYHPLAVTAESHVDDCLLELPATLWQPQVDLLPVGPPRPVANRTRGDGAPIGFPGPVPLAGLVLDDPFTGFAPTARGGDARPGIAARVIDRRLGAGIVAEWDPVFAACVLYTPPCRRAVCVEPSTVLPGQAAFDAAAGWRILDAGGAMTAWYALSTDGQVAAA